MIEGLAKRIIGQMGGAAPISPGPLSSAQVDEFIRNGFVRLESAFPRDLAHDCVQLLWPRIGCAPDAPGAWHRPVIRHPSWDAEPFKQAANTARLHGSFDQLVGGGRWLPRSNPGLFVIRFPSTENPGDAGWHIDGSFDVGGEWWVNFRSRGRALLMLFLFTDVGPDDAPTRIYVGSHTDVPPALQPLGEQGTHFERVMPLVPHVHKRAVASAVGNAGDVYLCHPFLVHAASWPHRGATPRFISQPELPPAAPLQIERFDADYSPVEVGVRLGLGLH
jgi:Phytanoyl-CoA dioxygenase (PhyH)